MTDTIDDWMTAAVEGIQCQAPHCDADPIAERNGSEKEVERLTEAKEAMLS